MRKKIYNLPLKTVCFLLLMFTLTLSVCSICAGGYLASTGGYQMEELAYLQQQLENPLHNINFDLAYNYSNEVTDSSSSFYPYSRYYDGNYRFELFDSTGKLLLSNYSGGDILLMQQDELTFHPSYNQQVHLFVKGYLLSGLEQQDQFSYLAELFTFLYQVRARIVWMAVLCPLSSICLAVYLLHACGRRHDQEGIVLGFQERIPLDLYLAVTGTAISLLVCLAIDLIETSIHMPLPLAFALMLACLLAGAALLTASILTLVVRGKYGHGYWWRHTVCFYVLRFVYRLCRRCLRFAGKVLRLCPVLWQWLLAGVALVALSFLLLNPYTSTLGYLFYIFLVFGSLLYLGWSYQVLRRGVARLARGSLQEKIPLRGLFGTFRDVANELNDLGQSASLAAQKQIRAERMKTELITNVSHDIKTPLTSIVNYVDLLQKPHTPEQGEQYLEVLSRQSQRMKKLTEDLVEMSKASSGNIPVSLTVTSAAELIHQALAEYEKKMAAAQLEPVLTAPDNLQVLADGRLFWRVMDNLLGNCVKYAQPGTRVYIDAVQFERKVLISIKNISKEPLNIPAAELMERFVRGDQSRNTEGSGLGLHIAKTLMELQKGKLTLTVDGDLFKAVLLFDSSPWPATQPSDTPA